MAEAKRARIALINDDTTFLDLMRDLLQDFEGYEVETCKETQDAYGFVKEYRPDLAIVDIRMGGEETGWTLMELLTLDPETTGIPLIVCSAAVRELHEHEPILQKFGVSVLPKPFDLDALLEKVRAGLARGEEAGPGVAADRQ